MDYKDKFEKLQVKYTELEQKMLQVEEQLTKNTDIEVPVEKNRASNILEGTNAGTWDWNIQTSEVTINERWAEIIGYSIEELQPININTWVNSLHPDDIIKAEKLLQQHFKKELDYYSCEIRQKHKNGEWIWVSARGKVIEWDTEEKPLIMYGTHLDITHRKKAEEILIESQERYKLLFNSINDAIFVHSIGEEGLGKFTDVNDIACKRLEYTKEELLEKTSSDLDDPDSIKDKSNIIKSLLKDGHGIFRVTQVSKSGKKIPAEVSSRIFLKENQKYVLSVVRDITERYQTELALKESEKKYRQLFENMTTGFALHEIICDKEGKPIDYRYIDVNPAFEKLTGMKASDVKGKNIKQLMPETEDYWIQSFGKVALTGESLSYENYAKEIDKHFNVYSFCPEPGKFAVVFYDITKRKIAEKALKESEVKYRSLFVSAGDGAMVLQAYKLIDCNDSTLTLLGGTREQILDLHPWDLAPPFQPDGTNTITKAKDVIDKTINGTPQRFEFQHKNLKGELIDTDISLNVVDREKKIIIAILRDITAAKKAETALKESEERFKAFMNNTPVFAYIKDATLNHIYSNKQIFEQFNLSIEKNISASKLFGKETAQILEKADLEVLNKKASNKVIEYAVKINGNNRWLRDIKFPIKMPDGTLLLGGVAIDITEQKNADIALADSYTKFKTLADYTYDWEYWKDLNDQYVYISPSCERIIGYKAEEFIQDPSLFKSLVIDEDREMWNTHLKETKKEVAFERPMELKIRTKKGKIKWINHVCRPVYDTQGNHIGNRGTNRDITVQKLSQIALTESELRFKQLSDLAFEGIVVHKNGIALNVNKALTIMSGLSESEILGKNIIEEFVPTKYHYLVNTNLMHTNVLPYEVEIFKKDGSLVPVEITAREISSKNQGLRVVSIRDITEQKQMQQKILNTIIQTEEQERKRIAQELHDGLGPVLSTIKLYTQTYINSNNTEFKEKIQEQLLAGIEDALEQTSSISNNLSPHVLNDFGLKVAIQKFFEKIQKLGLINIKFHYDYLQELEKDVEITLYRVSIELINNTLKHAKATKIEMDINGDEEHIFFNYRDDGIGFDFDKTKQIKRGMGLFNIVNRIKSLGGEVNFEHLEDKGILYAIKLPVSLY